MGISHTWLIRTYVLHFILIFILESTNNSDHPENKWLNEANMVFATKRL